MRTPKKAPPRVIRVFGAEGYRVGRRIFARPNMKNLYQQVKNGEVSRRLVESLRLFKANEASIRLMVSPYEAVQLLLDDTITHTAWASREGTEEVIITRARLQIDGKWHNLSVAIQKGREEFTIYFDHPQRRRQRM